jgi:molecular chaperone DnaK (HSP70)
MQNMIGIDVGNTHSRVAEHKYDRMNMLLNELGEWKTSTCVAPNEQVGDVSVEHVSPSLRHIDLSPEQVSLIDSNIVFFDEIPHYQYQFSDLCISVYDAVLRIIKKMKSIAEQNIGPVTKAAITVPHDRMLNILLLIRKSN